MIKAMIMPIQDRTNFNQPLLLQVIDYYDYYLSYAWHA
jgi:hypothetical protein